MRAKIWKKNAVLATVILFVCVAVYLNWHYGRESAGELSGVYAPEPAVSTAPENSDAGRIAAAPPVLTAEEEPVEDVGELEYPSEGEGYFASARLTREQARDASVEILRETAANEDAPQQARDDAYAALSRIADNAIREAQIEGLVMAKGFADCVAYISEDGISVVVSSPQDGLNSAYVTQIKDIVISETGVPAAAIRILEVSG